MAIYHAQKKLGLRAPLCGQCGPAGGFFAAVLGPAEFAALRPEQQCKKCVAKLTPQLKAE